MIPHSDVRIIVARRRSRKQDQARRELNSGGAATPVSIPAVADKSFLDPEKMILEWSELDGRIIEELR